MVISAGFSAERGVHSPQCLAQSGSREIDEKLWLARSAANCFQVLPLVLFQCLSPRKEGFLFFYLFILFFPNRFFWERSGDRHAESWMDGNIIEQKIESDCRFDANAMRGCII